MGTQGRWWTHPGTSLCLCGTPSGVPRSTVGPPWGTDRPFPLRRDYPGSWTCPERLRGETDGVVGGLKDGRACPYRRRGGVGYARETLFVSVGVVLGPRDREWDPHGPPKPLPSPEGPSVIVGESEVTEMGDGRSNKGTQRWTGVSGQTPGWYRAPPGHTL